MTYSVVIVEDEMLSADLLKTILFEINDEIGPFDIQNICHSGEEAVAAVKHRRPDILFLDINMPQGDGFYVVEKLNQAGIILPAIIFTTAHSRFAAKAYDIEAVDYLLKPISHEKIIRAIKRVDKLQAPEKPDLKMLKVAVKNGSEFINIDTIDVIEASGDYLYIHTEGRKIMVRASLRDYAAKLHHKFQQTHRSYLVNIDSITAINRMPKGAAMVILSSEQEIPVSRRYRVELLKLLPDMV